MWSELHELHEVLSFDVLVWIDIFVFEYSFSGTSKLLVHLAMPLDIRNSSI